MDLGRMEESRDEYMDMAGLARQALWHLDLDIRVIGGRGWIYPRRKMDIPPDKKMEWKITCFHALDSAAQIWL